MKAAGRGLDNRGRGEAWILFERAVSDYRPITLSDWSMATACPRSPLLTACEIAAFARSRTAMRATIQRGKAS